MSEDLFYFYLAGVPLLGIAAQWLAWRFRLPSILLLLGFGILLGMFVRPDDLLGQLADADGHSFAPKVLFPIVSLSVAVILFEGGLTLKVSELREAGSIVLRMVTIGVLVSWGLTTLFAHQFLGLDQRMAALIGAILVVTGPTVIGPLLRHIQPKRRVGSIAKWEGIVIDPVGAVLAVLVFQYISSADQASTPSVMLTLLKTVLIGFGLSFSTGWVLVQLVKRYWIPDFLQGVVYLSVALAVFAASDLLQAESGLVTVTLLGVYLANQKSVSVQHVIEFKEHLVVLLISCLFIVLGSRLDPREMLGLGWGGVAFLVAMILIVRPASVYIATFRSKIDWRERTFLAFLAPRGIVAAAVTSVFSLEVVHHLGDPEADPQLMALIDQAQLLVPITFLVIVGTVAVYGLFAGPLARLLKLAESAPQGILFAGAEQWVQLVAKSIQEEGFEVLLVDTSYDKIAEARISGLPTECASILSEHVIEESDLAGIGRMLAMTSNDGLNTLAAREFKHLFGSANVYQLAPWDVDMTKRASLTSRLNGRMLFDKELHHDKLANLIKHGMQIKKTRITERLHV